MRLEKLAARLVAGTKNSNGARMDMPVPGRSHHTHVLTSVHPTAQTNQVLGRRRGLLPFVPRRIANAPLFCFRPRLLGSAPPSPSFLPTPTPHALALSFPARQVDQPVPVPPPRIHLRQETEEGTARCMVRLVYVGICAHGRTAWSWDGVTSLPNYLPR